MLQIKVKIYLKKHLRPSYMLVFDATEKVEKFVDSLNYDVDYFRIGDEVIERKTIRKVVIE